MKPLVSKFCAGPVFDHLLHVDVCDFGIHFGDQPLDDAPGFQIGSDVEVRHLQARDAIRCFDIFVLAQAQIFLEHLADFTFVGRLENVGQRSTMPLVKAIMVSCDTALESFCAHMTVA